jgi:hypothetical protein
MCPVCQARFRGSSECSRCGADLGTIMGLAAGAWRMREAARQAIARGDLARARALAAQAQEICRTPAGGDLEMVSSWLAGSGPEMDKTAPGPEAIPVAAPIEPRSVPQPL